MAEKRITGRLIQKHDTEENWLKATNFIPMKGEIIVYDVDTNYDYERMKIGDGETLVSSLPFTMAAITDDEIDAICGQVLLSTAEIAEQLAAI